MTPEQPSESHCEQPADCPVERDHPLARGLALVATPPRFEWIPTLKRWGMVFNPEVPKVAT